LPGLLSPAQVVVAAEEPIPSFEPKFVPRRKRKWISASPGFGGRQAGKVLVRPDVVIEEAELGERVVKEVERIDLEPIELHLQRTEEAFDSAVLPWAAGVGSLVTDAEQ